MITRRGFAGGVLLGVAVFGLGGCGEYNPYRFRARVTVSVETPEGVRSGSSVYSVWANHSYPGTTRRVWGERGEAVAVDLPGGRTLFSLLKTSALHGDITSMVLATLDADFSNDMVASTQKFAAASGGEAVPVAVQNYPMLVTFKDITDPTSVTRVDPDNLAASFGAGYRLKAITVQVTDEPVATGIGARLAAIGMSPDNSLEKDFTPTTNPTLAQQLGYNDFVRK